MDNQAYKEGRHGTAEFPLAVYRGTPGIGRCVLYSHWHDEAEFFLLDQGQLTFFRDDQTVEVRAGEAIFIHRGEIHAAYASQGGGCAFTAIVFSLDMLACDRLGESHQRWWRPFIQGDCRIIPKITAEHEWGRIVLSQLADIVHAQREAAPGHEMAAAAGLYRIFSLLIQHGQFSSESPTSASSQASRLQVLKQVLLFMHANHTRKLSVAEIAGVAHMSVFHFSRYFKKMTGSTPLDYLVKYRIDQAEILLIKTERKILDIAGSVGFETVSHFIKTFRKFKQTSPANYRRTRAARQPPA